MKTNKLEIERARLQEIQSAQINAKKREKQEGVQSEGSKPHDTVKIPLARGIQETLSSLEEAAATRRTRIEEIKSMVQGGKIESYLSSVSSTAIAEKVSEELDQFIDVANSKAVGDNE
jgi:hypothetical protein